MARKDPEAARVYSREYQARPDVKDHVKRRIATRKSAMLLMVDARKAAPCMDCGGCFPAVVMEFDHRPGEGKYRDVSSIVHNGLLKSQRLFQEMDKCDMVCANCHRIRTDRRRRGEQC